MPKSSIYLGKIKLGWCTSCNLPLLDEMPCQICGNTAEKVQISPPGDIRPSFRKELELIRRVIDEQYGEEIGKQLIPDDKVILLNKVSYTDHMDEVIIDGKIIGDIRFEPSPKSWHFVPKLIGARRLWKAGCSKWIKVDTDAVKPIINGANILGPGVIDCSKDIKKDDQAIVLSPENEVIATGTVKRNAADILMKTKGIVLKPREHGPPGELFLLKGGQNWEDAVKANEGILQRYEQNAVNFIRNTSKSYDKPVTVAFSGGKDSLVTLLLTLKALGTNFQILFADTGVEFKETVEYTHHVLEELGLAEKLLEKKVDPNTFWNLTEKFGPPGRDYRICCKSVKLGPTSLLIEDNFPKGCITFIGQRRYESQARAKEKRVSVNPWVSKQISATPIQDWTALHVWLYIFQQKVPFNPLYEKGLIRIGCWPCPASKLAEFEMLKKEYPELWEKLQKALEKWRKKYNFPKEWIEHGFWRWKNLPDGQVKLMKELKISETIKTRPLTEEKLRYKIEKMPLDPASEESSLQVVFNSAFDMELIANFSNILGKVSYAPELGSIQINMKDSFCDIFPNGNFVLTTKYPEKAKKICENVASIIIRAMRCLGCGSCIPWFSSCNAFSLKGGKLKIIESKCTHCSRCLEAPCTALYANS
nr:phosphoadenosine phosphosulfate reductase family protein [Candidatus Freyarchaeota archaeon]